MKKQIKLVKSHLQQNHILLMPSYYEGMPIALIEAMLCGRTAVATDVGGNAEVLTDNETGFISPGVNTDSFEKALEEAWQNKENWQEMGEMAYNDAYAHFKTNSFNIDFQ